MMVEVNERLCQFVSDKIWEGHEKQDFYVKVELSDPSPLMQHEQLREILHFAQSNVQPDTEFEHSWRYAWTIDGRPIRSGFDLHMECRVVLVSSKNKFKGLRMGKESIKISDVEPTPRSWISHTALTWQSKQSSLQTS
jgi:hypothetical protein